MQRYPRPDILRPVDHLETVVAFDAKIAEKARKQRRDEMVQLAAEAMDEEDGGPIPVALELDPADGEARHGRRSCTVLVSVPNEMRLYSPRGWWMSVTSVVSAGTAALR